jgi:transposase
MESSITLRRSEGKELLEHYSRSPDPAIRLRAHIVLLLAAGYPWATIATMLFCSTRTIARWKHHFEQGGVRALLTDRRCRASPWPTWLIGIVARWVTECTPRDFGFLRSRWCCGAVVVLLVELYHVKVSTETVQHWLHRENLVWRRPRPVIKPQDPHRKEKLKKLRYLLANLPADEIAVFQDEVDISTNPKIGSMWMVRGEQALVETPGNNEKRYLAGSLNWRTGDLIVTEGLPGEGRNSALFIRHLDDLRYHLRRYRKIHVICDNARFHDCRAVHQHLGVWGHRIVLHFLPKRAPETNPIERIWWHLHEEITRNHRCQTIDELIALVFDWLENRVPFAVERDVYLQGRAA